MKYRTTLWENIKGRVQYLKKNKALLGDGVEWAKAIVEELERIEERLDDIEAWINTRKVKVRPEIIGG
jgi:hypothetical protein